MPQHPAFPFRFDAGLLVMVEQDSPGHMLGRVHATVLTPVGSREDDPSFGIPDDLERVGGVRLDELARAIEECEPDIDLTITRPGEDGHDDGLFVALEPRTDTIHLHVDEGED